MKNRNKFKTPYIPALLTPKEVRFILNQLNIDWPKDKVNPKGWVTINSPLRSDKRPSFSINVNEGCFIDHGDPGMKGDIIKLISNFKGYNQKRAERWVIKLTDLDNRINLNY